MRALNPATASRLLFLSSLAWLAAIVIAPFGFDLPYRFGSVICHQQPSRSFWIAGRPMPVCARCTGLYASASAGALLALVAGRRRGSGAAFHDPRETTSPRLRASTVRKVVLVAAVPTAATVALEWLGLASPGSIGRFIAAVPLGAVVGWIVASLLQEAG